MNLSEPPESSRNSCADVAATDAILLRQAVEKLVRYGYKVGVTPEEMISLLYSGLSVRDMLEVVFRTSLKPNLSMIQRRLRVVKWLSTTPAVGVCTLCNREFKVPMTALRRTADAQASLQEQFDRHRCEPEDTGETS